MLRKKMFRDIKFNKAQFIAIFLMVLLGVLAYSGIRSYMLGMEMSADKFYTENNLQDLQMVGEGFSEEDLEKIKDFDNVNDAELRLTLLSTIENDKDLTMELNFINSNNISKFYVTKGEGFDREKSGVWLDSYFADKNDWRLGDVLTFKYDGITLTEEIVGLINVPDHVYDTKDESVLFPDHSDYGFAYLSIKEFPESYLRENLEIPNNLEFNYEEYIPYNYILVDVDKEENKQKVKAEIEEKIVAALVVTDIKDTKSYSVYQGEIEEGQTYVGVFSGLFLFIAVLSVITTMTRIVKKQRIQIGTLKALGFKDSKITLHYVSYGFWISTVAGIAGFILGPLLIGTLFIRMEMAYFEVPNGKAMVDDKSFLVMIIAIALISFVTYLTCRRELKDSAADTLREKLPTVKNSKVLSMKIFRKMKFSTKWNLCDVLRNKIRTFMGIVGIVGCTMILVCAFGMLDSLNYFIKWQFEDLYNFKYKLTLKANYSGEEYEHLIEEYGNSTSETLGIEIKVGEEKKANNIFVSDCGNYVRFTDEEGNYMTLPDDSIIITQKLSENEGYKIGDIIKWHIYGEETYYESKIVGFDRDPQNQNLKMSRKYLESLGIEYRPDSIYTNEKLDIVEELEGVELVQDKEALETGMNSMLNTMKSMIVLLIVVAIILCVVIIYNLGVLSFAEKQYQFATLKVLGFKNKQIKKIYVKQNRWITIVSIIIGLPVGFYLTDFLFKMAIAENYDMEANISLLSYIIAAVVTFVVSSFSSGMLAKKIDKLDMVTSLKGNE